MMKDFLTLKKNIKKDFSSLQSVKVALLGDSATQLLHQAIKGFGFEVGVNFEIYEADFGQIEQQILDISSELYAFNPQYVIVFQSSQKLYSTFCKSTPDQKKVFAHQQKETLQMLCGDLERAGFKVLLFNFVEINDTVFGNYANKTEQSFVYQIRKLNLHLMDMAIMSKNIFVLDLSLIQNQVGYNFLFDAKNYVNASMVISLDALPIVVKNLTDIIQASRGTFKKCLILDLDNTLWGGIIGDDGMENIQIGDLGIGKAYTELQLWIKQLKQRGIILAVCSKNTESIAKEVFENHPDMVLRLDDIAVFVANWENKVDNIRHIQRTLNIGLDSMVFLDDNSFERNMVKENIPELTVPELPEDPVEYLNYLRTLNLFETASFTQEDALRTAQYQSESKRAVFEKSFTNEDEFLASLEMKSDVRAFDKFNTPRVSQLTLRSNQFNLRTVRYTEDEISKIASSDNYITLALTLEDKFGDNGLISVVILKKQLGELFIDTWIMSCRVLKRGMENFTLNEIIGTAKQQGFKKVIGEFLPTKKNGMVKDHYLNLGFTDMKGMWGIDVVAYLEKKCFIKRK